MSDEAHRVSAASRIVWLPAMLARPDLVLEACNLAALQLKTSNHRPVPEERIEYSARYVPSRHTGGEPGAHPCEDSWSVTATIEWDVPLEYF